MSSYGRLGRTLETRGGCFIPVKKELGSYGGTGSRSSATSGFEGKNAAHDFLTLSSLRTPDGVGIFFFFLSLDILKRRTYTSWIRALDTDRLSKNHTVYSLNTLRNP